MFSADEIWEKLQKGLFIIAEAGKNFIQTEKKKPVSEYLKNAKEMVDIAAESGAHAIKFQTHFTEDEIPPGANFISPHFFWKEGRYAWVDKNFRATPAKDFWLPLKEYAESREIVFFSTPMSRGAARILNEEVGVNLWKVGSGDMLDFVMLDYMRHTDKPIIMSSGMSTWQEVEKAFNFLKAKNDRVAVLHCVSKYPCDPEDLRLGTMLLLQEKFNAPIGFSDHSLGSEAAAVAVAKGATILEKHLTISRKLWGPDHQASLEPPEFRRFVNVARQTHVAPQMRDWILESGYAKRCLLAKEKVVQDGEAEFRSKFRKALRAGRDIPAGAAITAEMVYAMRPQESGGLPSERYEDVVGRRAKITLKKYDPITEDSLE